MPRKEGAKPKLLRYFLENVGREIPRKELEELCKDNGTEWARSLRSLRDDGWVYEYNSSKNTYLFPYSTPQNEPKDSRYIPNDVKSLVMIRDNSTCQMCGKSVMQDHIKIHLDHIVPLEWGGTTTVDNLQCLCKDCNEGKKNWVASEDPSLMIELNKATSAKERLLIYFLHYPDKEISVEKLEVVAKTRGWERALRYLRSENNMNIKALPPKKGVRDKYCYIYITNE